MNVSQLLRELSSHGIEFEPRGLSLPAPKWPAHVPQELRLAFAQNRRRIMSRIAPPLFIYFDTHRVGAGSTNSNKSALNDAYEFDLCLCLIDDQVIIWLPGVSPQLIGEITRRTRQLQLGMNPESTQVSASCQLPLLLRRAVRSGRSFCSWDGQTLEASVLGALSNCDPVRWIGVRDLARAGGWPEDFDSLLWNLLLVRPAQNGMPTNRPVSNVGQSQVEVVDYWSARIRTGLHQLMGTADLYDRLKQFDEPDIVEMHHEVNSHGIGLDFELTRIVCSLAREYAETRFSYIAQATDGAMTVAQLLDDEFVLSWLESWGLRFPNLHAATIEWLLNQTRSAGLQHPSSVEAVLQARLSLARQPTSSLPRALDLVDERNQVCQHMNYYANSSGEFGSSGIAFGTLIAAGYSSRANWQEMCKSSPNLDDLVSWLPPDKTLESMLAVMTADCFVPSSGHVFQVCCWTYLKVEVLSWLVGQQLPLLSFGTNSPIDQARRELAQQVRCALTNGERTEVGKCGISISQDVVEVRLPSGRAIHYRNVSSFSEGHATTVGEITAPPPSATTPLRDVLNENVVADDIVRGICRDILAAAMLSCADADTQIVAHGPDFFVMEIPIPSFTKRSELLLDRLRPPEWAPGLLCGPSSRVIQRLGCGGNWKVVEQNSNSSIFF